MSAVLWGSSCSTAPRSQVPVVHLSSSQVPKALPSPEGPWHSLELSLWGRAQTGTAWHGCHGTDWAALPQLGSPQREQQGLQSSQDPELLLWKCGTHPCTAPFKQCWNLPPWEGTSLGQAPWMLQRGESLSEPHTPLCTHSLFTSPSKGCVFSVPVLAPNQPVTKRLYFSMIYRSLFET